MNFDAFAYTIRFHISNSRPKQSYSIFRDRLRNGRGIQREKSLKSTNLGTVMEYFWMEVEHLPRSSFRYLPVWGREWKKALTQSLLPYFPPSANQSKHFGGPPPPPGGRVVAFKIKIRLFHLLFDRATQVKKCFPMDSFHYFLSSHVPTNFDYETQG
jgi:hypothetical protein